MVAFRILKTLAFTVVILQVVADINFKHCLGPGDFGPNTAIGIYPNACVLNHCFHNRKHAWSFANSVIRNTNFTHCTMEDTPTARQNYLGATWENVLFQHCKFRNSPEIKFEETFFKNVVFENCSFHASADILFSKFRFSNVEFRDCTFSGKIKAELGTIRRLVISDSTFGSSNRRRQARGDGTLEFSQMTMSRFMLNKSVSHAEIRVEQANVEDFEIMNSTLSSLHCHEPVIGGRNAKKSSQFNNTMMLGTTFSDGLFWDECNIHGLEMHDTKIQNRIDLRSSKINRLAVLNITSLSNDTCSTFDLSSATVHGDLFRGIDTDKVLFRKTFFKTHMTFNNFSIANTTFDLSETIFSTEMINSECCTVSCAARECLCDVPVEPTGTCPPGNSSVNINVHDSCFPGDAVVYVVTPFDIVVPTAMRNLRHGDRVLHGSKSGASPVYFFGHKDVSQRALFRIITTVCNETCAPSELAISNNHLLSVRNGGLLPARNISIGDMLYGVDGKDRMVTSIRQEIRIGVFAPTTIDGTLVVNGIVVSCYTDIVPVWVAHAILAPLRGLYAVGGGLRHMLQRIDVLHKRSAAPLVRSFVKLVCP